MGGLQFRLSIREFANLTRFLSMLTEESLVFVTRHWQWSMMSSGDLAVRNTDEEIEPLDA